MDILRSIQIWDSVSIDVVSVKHRLLLAQSSAEFFESSAFFFCLGKSGSVLVEETPYRFNGHLLMHVPPDQRVIIDSGSGEAEVFCLEYRATILPEISSGLMSSYMERNPFHELQVVRCADPGNFYDLFEKLADGYSSRDPTARISLKASFYALIHRLYAELLSGKTVQQKMDCGDYVLRYLQGHFAEPVSIQNLADRLQISRSTLTGRFRKKHGVSPTAYLMQRRLEAAAEMLSETPYSVDEIAQRCGLRDTSYLSRVFKRQYGVSPGAYRRASGNMAKYQAQYYAGVRPGLSDEGENLIRVENMGRIHRYYGMLGRIVCLDYCAAEICAALGIADRMTGIASAEESLLDCREEYRPQLGKIPFLSGRSLEVNVPSFEAVCACRPDMVIGTGYSFQRSGVAPAEMFEEKGIHVYAMTATFSVGCGFDSVYRDIRNIAGIFGRQRTAEKLIDRMRRDEEMLEQLRDRQPEQVRVFVYDSSAQEKALTCARTLEDHMIRAAGGVNVFGDRSGLFLPVSWEEVTQADPQVIIVHYFHDLEDGRQKLSFLKQQPAVMDTDAGKNGRFLSVGIKRVFPGLDCTETALRFSSAFHGSSALFEQ